MIMPDYAWVLIITAPLGYLRLVAHEASHVAAAWAVGTRAPIDRFAPWPHKADGKWFWGRMGWENLPGQVDDLLVYMAPLARAIVCGLAVVPMALEVWTPLWVWVGWEVTDVIHWARGWASQPTSDGGKTRAILEAVRASRAL